MRNVLELSAVAGLIGVALACDPTLPDPPVEDLPPCASEWTVDHTPIQVDEFVWNGQTVWHADFGCCDRYLEVWSAQCEYVCAPSGGFAAFGDGLCPTFYDEAVHVGIAWVE